MPILEEQPAVYLSSLYTAKNRHSKGFRSFYRLTVNRHGTYTIRLCVPKPLQSILKAKELKRSLGTRDFHRARTLATHLSFNFELLLATVMKKKLGDFNLNHSNDILRELKVKWGNAEFDIDETTPEGMQAYITLIEAMSKQQSNLVVENISSTPKQHIYKSKYKLKEVKESYFAERSKTSKSKKSVNITMGYIEECFLILSDEIAGGMSVENLSITTITKETAIKYKQVLMKMKDITPQTIDQRISALSSFFTWIKKNTDYPFDNPFFNLKLLNRRTRKKHADPYVAFSSEELQLIFKEENYQKYHKNDLALYYAPIIGLYSGMRVTEACQLLIEDIELRNGILIFNVTDMNDDEENQKQIKNSNAKRPVPIHSKIVELRFLEYVEALKKLGHKTLFPQEPSTISKYFNKYIADIGVKKRRTDKGFHSLRKNVNICMMKNKVEKAYRCQIIGHDYDDTNSVDYGQEATLEELKEIVDIIKYDVEISKIA
jgi:integrase